MGSSFTPAIERLLREAGCHFVRHGKGDHDIWYSPITQRTFTVDRNTRSRHTANAMLKDAGLSKSF
ncbi:MAG: type II toxin-antitoxin system HicA family toxin [Burkholderiales bacterium]|nr:MAG: type II toxin-antitoxin system HicA family toxin [Betaproteobacteria bacterium]TAG81957.1 MAG: type II toxin-antitoxin system HicA family toxin [Betaproteobacteria bacterium]TAG84273.1 MAG: type II toxin-antitoxin system HicA family toxin [Burkholderiales bacterium]